MKNLTLESSRDIVLSVDKKPFWTIPRREFIAKRCGEVFMITIAAAYASDFFAKFSIPTKLFILFVVIIVLVVGLLISRKEGV